MALSAALSAGGARPASFLPTIKCSNCGDQIEISAMGEHLCEKTAGSPHTSIASMSSTGSGSSNGNPFALRAAHTNPSKPATPSPLQFSSSEQPPLTRARAPTLGASQQQVSKAQRPPPPRINPDTANRPFLAPIPRPESPISPALSSRSGSSMGKPPPIRSTTSPAGRFFDPRPPSPEMSANLDCAFPPFPTSSTSDSRPPTSNGRKTPNSERAPSRGGSRQDGRWPGEGSDMNKDSKHPLPTTRGSMMDKMSTLRSGPFDTSRRRPSKEERQDTAPGTVHQRRASKPFNPPTEPLPSLPTSKFGQSDPAVLTEASAERTRSPETSGSGDKKMPPPRPHRYTEEVLSPRFLGQFSAEPSQISSSDARPSLQGSDRSKTFPLPKEEVEQQPPMPNLTRMKSEPELRGRQRRSTVSESTPPASRIPQMPHPPRSQSRTGDRVDHRLDNAPPVPKPVQQLNRSNSQHRPSESGSSTSSSVNSVVNNNSTRGPSPISSAASSVDTFSPLGFESEPYGEEKGMRVPGLNIKNQRPGMRAEVPRERKSPPKDFSRPTLPTGSFTPLPETRQETVRPGLDREQTAPPSSNWPLESPMDPAMQQSKLNQPPQGSVQRPMPTRSTTSPNVRLDMNAALAPAGPSSDDYDPYRPRSPYQQGPPPKLPQLPQQHTRARSKTNAGPTPRPSPVNAPPPPRSLTPQLDARPPPRAHTPQPNVVPPSRSQTPQPAKTPMSPIEAPHRPLQPPPTPQDAPRPQLARRQTSGRAICRGCNVQIEGKSVKAADGRLTGRWHKACFVCRTCTQPFTTADFYVIANQPYCEQHYHEKNGSCCAGCQRGIEGQYLETVSGQGDRKFHPRCFTCADCHIVLQDDYFEIGGKVFCERHALANMRSQARVVGPSGLGAPAFQGPGRSPLVAERRTTRLMMM